MSTATLDFSKVENRSHDEGRVLVAFSCPAERAAKRQEEAYWSERSRELLEIFKDEDRPVVSGSFGSFLF